MHRFEPNQYRVHRDEQEASDEGRVRSERSEQRLRAVLAEAQEAVHGWEVAEDGIEELERQLGLLRTRVAATEAELAASRVRVVNMPYHDRAWSPCELGTLCLAAFGPREC